MAAPGAAWGFARQRAPGGDLVRRPDEAPRRVVALLPPDWDVLAGPVLTVAFEGGAGLVVIDVLVPGHPSRRPWPVLVT